jgi:hypothetical protein
MYRPHVHIGFDATRVGLRQHDVLSHNTRCESTRADANIGSVLVASILITMTVGSRQLPFDTCSRRDAGQM